MDKYVKLQNVLETLKKANIGGYITDRLMEIPATDVQPVKRGHWMNIMMSEAAGWDLSLTGGKDAVCETVCSVCGGGCAFGGDGEVLLSQYCPDCGARMDGEQNEGKS